MRSLLGDNAEVVNLGVPGYSTDQELLLLQKEGHHYAPDFVVLCFLLNDVEGALVDFNYGLGKPQLKRGVSEWGFHNMPVKNHPSGAMETKGLLSTLAEASAIWQLSQSREHSFHPEGVSHRKRKGLPTGWQTMFKEAPWTMFSEAEIDYFISQVNTPESPILECFRRLQDTCNELGAELVVFSVAHHHDQHLFVPGVPLPDRARRAIAEDQPYLSRLARAVQTAGSQIGFETFSVDQAMFDAVRSGLNLNVGDGHLTPAGHEILAREIARFLRPRLGAAIRPNSR